MRSPFVYAQIYVGHASSSCHPSNSLPSPSWVTVGDLSNVAHIPSLPGPFFSIRPGRELEDGREMSQGMRESERARGAVTTS